MRCSGVATWQSPARKNYGALQEATEANRVTLRRCRAKVLAIRRSSARAPADAGPEAQTGISQTILEVISQATFVEPQYGTTRCLIAGRSAEDPGRLQPTFSLMHCVLFRKQHATGTRSATGKTDWRKPRMECRNGPAGSRGRWPTHRAQDKAKTMSLVDKTLIRRLAGGGGWLFHARTAIT